jgi:hypothetical protein
MSSGYTDTYRAQSRAAFANLLSAPCGLPPSWPSLRSASGGVGELAMLAASSLQAPPDTSPTPQI